MKILKRFKYLIIDHWFWAAFLFLIFVCIICLLFMESYYAQMLILQAPYTVVMTVISAAVFAYVLIMVQFGAIMKMHIPIIRSKNIDTTFKDVIGLEESKKEAMEVVELIKDRTRIQKIGGKIIRGLLMIGPPGCGKTMLAKAIAKESGIPFISVAGSEFNEVFVGVGAGRVRRVFRKARQVAEIHGAAIVFIDEVDVIGQRRTFNMFGSGEGNSTQNQLLVELDGLREKPLNVIVIAATNAAESILDKALLRAGRFDRKIYIGRPGLEDREALYHYYMGKVKHDPSIDIGRLARKSVFKTPADIENIIKEAALIATRDKRDVVEFKDISAAIERIELGVKHKRKMTEEERIKVAHHEAGHLVTLYILHPTDDVFKASIIHRGGTLGVVHHQPREEFFTEDKEKLLADIKASLAGYVAEKIKFGVTSSGVASDFSHAMFLAHAMVWNFGMANKNYIGDFTAIPHENLSDSLKDNLNEETQKILQECYKEVESLLKKEWDIVERFVKELLQKDELEYDEIEAIFNEYGKTNPYKKSSAQSQNIQETN